MTTPTIAILGAGNMGASLLGGLLAQSISPDSIWITDIDTEKLAQIKTRYRVHTTTDNRLAVSQAHVVILAVKPQMLAALIPEIASFLQRTKPLVISIMAGVLVKSLEQALGNDIPIVRTMPNMPALIQCGMTALYANAWVTEKGQEMAEKMMQAVGATVWVKDESMLDAITALSGSGPAYFFLVIEALEAAAQELGLSKDVARLLTLQTAYGSAKMALSSECDSRELRQRVTSPGGTTEQAIQVLETEGLRAMFKHALQAAQKRSQELATLFNQTLET